MSPFTGKEFEDLHEEFGVKYNPDHNGNNRRNHIRSSPCRRASSKKVKKHKTPQLNLAVKKVCFKKSATPPNIIAKSVSLVPAKASEAFNPKKNMSKKFTFKPPVSVASRPPQLNVAPVPSVQVSQGSQQLAKTMEDLWLDDIDEDMLVQASQIAESKCSSGEQNTPERMEIDSAAMNKFIEEESQRNTGDVWTQSRVQQTQIVYQNKPSTFATVKEPIRKPQQQPFKMISSKPVDHNSVGAESMEKLKAELKSYVKKLQAKEGEVKYLRNSLNEKKIVAQNFLKYREEFRKEKENDLKKFEAEKKKMEEQAKSSREFLQRELEQAFEALQKFERADQNISDNGDSRNGNRRQLSPEAHDVNNSMQPSLKKQKLGQRAMPMNIDETLFSQKPTNHQEVLVPKKMTVDACFQTSCGRRRSKVLDFKPDEQGFGALMEIGVKNSMIKSLHDTMRNQLTNLLDQIRKLSSKLQDNDVSAAEVDLKEFENAMILIDHLQLNLDVDLEQRKYPDLMLDELFNSLLCLMENRQRVNDENLSKSIVNLINSIVQNEAFQDLIDQRNLIDNLVAALEQSRSLMTVPGRYGLVAIDVFVGIMDLLALETNMTKKIFCNHIKDMPDLTSSFWSFVQYAKFQGNGPFGYKENLSLMTETMTRMIWRTTSFWSICDICQEAIVKALVTVTCAVVAQLSSEEEQPSPILLQAAKSALLCLHHIWESDEKSFIKALSAIPKIQRRYVWSINHLLNLTEAKHIKLEFDCLINDLDFETD